MALSPAETLLKSLGITDPDEIDLDAIAEVQNARVHYRQLDGCEAQIIGLGDKAIITIRKNAHPLRKRFSLAHELGHWRHHRGQPLYCRPEDIDNPAHAIHNPERVADSYASDLLLPRYMFEPRARQAPHLTVELAIRLSEEFQSSLTSTLIRLVEMGPEPAMLVCHTEKGRKWFVRGREVPDHWFPRADLDADSYAFGVVFGSDKKTRRAKIAADAWFDRYNADQFEILEQTVKVYGGQALTLLTFVDPKMLEDPD